MLAVCKCGSNACDNRKLLEEMDCFMYPGSQVAADGGCEEDVLHKMNEYFKGWEC